MFFAQNQQPLHAQSIPEAFDQDSKKGFMPPTAPWCEIDVERHGCCVRNSDEVECEPYTAPLNIRQPLLSQKRRLREG